MNSIKDPGIAQNLIDVEEYIAQVERERDEARAQLAERRQAADYFDTRYQEQQAKTRAALAEVERLRAAPQLPEVGPVTRLMSGVLSVGDDYRWHDLSIDQHEESALRELAVVKACRAFLDAEAADTTPGCGHPNHPSSDHNCTPFRLAPDTSLVTFGARHEGTGMVLLRHADLGGNSWGEEGNETDEWHRDIAARSTNLPSATAAHAALAEVREALNTAETDGVDVDADGAVWCKTSPSYDDELDERAEHRARRFLAREVQAFVDQGLRGDDLNARLPYEVRDHRTPVEAAAPDNDDEACACPNCREARAALNAHRARSAEGGVTA